MLSLKPSCSSLSDFGDTGLPCSPGLKFSASSSCQSSPLFLPKRLLNTKNTLATSSGDSFLLRFAASIENMQRSSECLERLSQAENITLNHSNASFDVESDNPDSQSIRHSPSRHLSDSENVSIRAPSVNSSHEACNTVDYSQESANRWVELTNIDMSPVLPQRRSRTFCESARQVLNKIDPHSLQRYPMTPSPTRPMYCFDIPSPPSQPKRPKDPNEGSVHFKFQYLIVTERLKVTVIKASNIFKGERPDVEVSAYAEVCLMPGKLQRQFSKPTRAAANPTFDHVVYFHGISLFETHQMCLRIKIMTKERVLKTPRLIGEVTVSLDDFDLVSETVMEENFNTRIGSRSGSRYGVRRMVVQ